MNSSRIMSSSGGGSAAAAAAGRTCSAAAWLPRTTPGDRLRIDKALGFRKSDNKMHHSKSKSNVRVCYRLCAMQVEDISVDISEVGVVGNSRYEYVVEMVIQPQ